MRAWIRHLVVQVLAVVVTIWLVSHSVFIFDTGYRTSLRALWEAKHGPANYTRVLTPGKMVEVASGKKRDFLEGHNKARGTTRPWAAVEEVLENALVGMFERTDPMKAWELKKLGSTAWQSVGKLLRRFGRGDEPSPAVSEQTKVLIYNRIPKSGSSLLLELLYTLGGRLGYLVVRGKYHSYRHFTRNDRAGLGHFLEQAGTRARTVYVQHQHYVNFTQPPHRLPQPLYINMMRDPVDHLLSSYFYKRTVILQHRNPITFTKEEREIMEQPFEQCVVERRLECVYYGYTVHTNKTEQLEFRKTWSPLYLYPSDVLLYFCGHDPECTELGNRAALQKAKENVDRHFEVVGVLEHLQESLSVLEYKLPDFFEGASEWHQSTDQAVRNKNSVKAAGISEEVRAALKSRLAPEYDLYEHVRQRLLAQYEKLPDHL